MQFCRWLLWVSSFSAPLAAGQTIGPAPAPELAPQPAPLAEHERVAAVAALGGMRMAVLGDSLTTGAVTNPALTLDTRQLWEVFSGRTSVAPLSTALPRPSPVAPLPAPTRLWPAKREFLGGADWLWRNLGQALARTYLDTEEYSWGYQLGLDLYPDDARKGGQFLAIAAENGARTSSMSVQVERLLEVTDGALPEKVFASYTGNDLCATSLAGVSEPDAYREALRRGLSYLAINGRPAPGGSDIYVLGFLNVLQLIHADSILDKKVRAFGGEATCRSLREQGFRPADDGYDPGLPENQAWFAMLMPPNPAGYCATLFSEVGGKEARAELSSHLANRIRTFREIQQDVVREMNDDPRFKAHAPPLRFHYIAETSTLAFTGEDIAGDCFHLSLFGQRKLADAVLTGLGKASPSR